MEKRYSPAACVGARRHRVEGKPDRQHVSTKHVERHNLSMRVHMVALDTLCYNFTRIHKTLKVTPVMETGLSKIVWGTEELVRIMDERASRPAGPMVPTMRLAVN